MVAGVTIYAGTIVVLTSAGYAQGCTGATSEIVVGLAESTVTNAGADGAVKIPVRSGVFKLSCSGLAVTDGGKLAYAADNQTISLSSAAGPPVGPIGEVLSGGTSAYVYVGTAISPLVSMIAGIQNPDSDLSTLAASTGAALIGTVGGSTVQGKITSFALFDTALAASGGAAVVGTVGGSTVQGKITALVSLTDALNVVSSARSNTVVANGTALEALSIASLDDGHLCYVTALDGNYRLRKTSTATDYNQFVFTASGGTGRWISEPTLREMSISISAATLQALGNGVMTYSATLPGDPTLAAQAFVAGGGGSLYHEEFTNGGAATYVIDVGLD